MRLEQPSLSAALAILASQELSTLAWSLASSLPKEFWRLLLAEVVSRLRNGEDGTDGTDGSMQFAHLNFEVPHAFVRSFVHFIP